MSSESRDPRAELAARLTAAGLTNEASNAAAQDAYVTSLSDDPTDDEVDAEAEKIVAKARFEDFVPGHAKRFLHDLKERVLKERAAEGNPLAELDRRMAEGAGSSASELDRRLGLIRRT